MKRLELSHTSKIPHRMKLLRNVQNLQETMVFEAKTTQKTLGYQIDNGVCTSLKKLQLLEHKLKQSELSSFITWYNLNLGKWYENVRIAINFFMLIDPNIYAKGQRFHAG